jgi:hypothetical protein
MLIARCAWHRQYFGYRSFSGVASWRGLSLRFTDGICPRCLDHFRSDHQRQLDRRPLPRSGAQTSATGTAA